MVKAIQNVEPLTEEQRRLVGENLGLVAVHLRRHVSNLVEPRRDREWEDLFQEGCLGLARAAVRYRPERGIAFAAFALPRIHHAVSKALQTKFSTVHIPPPRAAGSHHPRADGDAAPIATRPKVYELSEEHLRRLVDRKSGHPGRRAPVTIRQRLREKYERAVRMAAEVLVAGKTSSRGDRAELVRIVIEERLLVPHDEAKRSFRRIARDTQSSCARVVNCEGQLRDMVRRILEADPEFRELCRYARRHPDGPDLPIDAEVQRVLLRAGNTELMRRYRQAAPLDRARVLHRVLTLSQTDVEDLLCTRFARLSARAREQLLESTANL